MHSKQLVIFFLLVSTILCQLYILLYILCLLSVGISVLQPVYCRLACLYELTDVHADVLCALYMLQKRKFCAAGLL